MVCWEKLSIFRIISNLAPPDSTTQMNQRFKNSQLESLLLLHSFLLFQLISMYISLQDVSSQHHEGVQDICIVKCGNFHKRDGQGVSKVDPLIEWHNTFIHKVWLVPRCIKAVYGYAYCQALSNHCLTLMKLVMSAMSYTMNIPCAPQ